MELHRHVEVLEFLRERFQNRRLAFGCELALTELERGSHLLRNLPSRGSPQERVVVCLTQHVGDKGSAVAAMTDVARKRVIEEIEDGGSLDPVGRLPRETEVLNLVYNFVPDDYSDLCLLFAVLKVHSRKRIREHMILNNVIHFGPVTSNQIDGIAMIEILVVVKRHDFVFQVAACQGIAPEQCRVVARHGWVVGSAAVQIIWLGHS